ncbi:MAG TPA: peptidylprolyl isomerase [Burkholderiaceae bacterium]|nr:peptidylprolyl isomerase [Burkholderiaceae bacterium]
MTLHSARLLVLLVATAALPALAQNLAVVNGKPVPSSRVDVMVKQMTTQGQQDSPQLRAMIKEELINREILLQEANKLGLGNTPDVKNQLELARQSIIIRALVADYVKKNPVKEADMKAEYDRFKAQAGDKEYHARHILVENEDEAKAIVAKLKAGAKFEELAKQSKDPGSAPNGGDLDWASPGSFVKPFSDAMVALQKGQFTETPVKTQFGYHVIKLEDVRPAKVPAFEEVKPQIAESLQQQKLQAYQQELRKKAKIQ